MSKFVNSSGLAYFWSKLEPLIDAKVDKVAGKTLTTYDFSAAYKTKLDGIAAGANAYVHPSATAYSAGLYKVTVNNLGHVTAATAVTKADITALGIPAYNTDTHYTSKNVVGAATATSNTTTALANGNVYLNSVENGAVTSAHKISGAGAATVTTDTSGNIIVTSTNTVYTHPTSSGYKHIPAGGSSGQILRWSADGTAVWGADNNTTYNLASFGITATATELNYTDGVTSNIQTQLNAKAASSHTHSYLPLAGGTLTGMVNANAGITIPMVAGQWISGMTATQLITFTGSLQSSYSALIKAPMYNGDIVNIGMLGTRFGFYAYKSGRTENAYDAAAYIDSSSGLFVSTNGFHGPLIGNADTATALTRSAGSATQPVYFSGGRPVATTYTLGKSVPSNAVFTDTVYTHPSATAYASGLYKVTVNSLGHVTAATAVTKADITALGIPAYNTDTHYASKNVVGAATATSNTTTALTNGNVYLNSVENGAVTSAHKISGAGATTVTTDTSGNIVVTSSNTVYTHPSATAYSAGLYKVTVNSLGHVTAATAVTKADITALGIPSADTNTHYTSKNVVGSATATSNTTTALTNGNVYLNSVENGAVTSAHKISGAGAATVTTDTSGNIVVTSANTVYTHPTTSGNKHIPSGGSSGQILRWSADGTAVWGADNNTTYTLSSFGITATAAELNCVKGVTSAIQTQLNGKAASSHTHSYLPLAGGTLTGILTASKGISIPTIPGMWISGMTATQCITFTGATDTGYSPMIRVVCASGNVGTIGVLGNQFGFYIYKNGNTANGTNGYAYINTETGQFHSSYGFVGSLIGNADTATALTRSAGSATQPVYFSGGKPVATTYTLAKSVPSNAVFTDTVYTHPSATAYASGLYKVTVNNLGHVTAATAVTKADITALGIPAYNTDTHYASKNVVGAATATSNTTTALTNGNVYLNSVENGAVTSAHKISGAGATTVTTDTSGNIVVTSTNTVYTHPTSAGYKHIPAGGSSGQILRWSAAGTAVWGADNNTTYTLSSFGITATAAELNCVKGVTSAIQTQLNGKAASSHTHSYLPLAGGTLTGTLTTNGEVITNNGVTINLTSERYLEIADGPSLFGSSESARTIALYRMSDTKAFAIEDDGDALRVLRLNPLDSTDRTFLFMIGAMYGTGRNAIVCPTLPIYGNLDGNARTATTATKLSTSAGSATQPVYFSEGKPVATTYTLGKSVPSNAVFTDTVYTHPTSAGYKHIPAGGSSGQILRWSAAGTAVWGADNNTTYTLASFGITATATELNYTDGVTSNIQTQLNAKAASSHTHSYLPLSGGTLTGILTASKGIFIRMTPTDYTIGMNSADLITFYNTEEDKYCPMVKVVCASGNVGQIGTYGDHFGFYVFTVGNSANSPGGYAYIDTGTGKFHSSDGFVGSLTGNASTATALTTSAGSATQPVYFNGGKPVATTYTLAKSVPSNAVFTDTVYTHPTSAGYKHIPAGGSSGQILRWSAAGTAVWGADNNTTYTLSSFGITATAAELNYVKGVTSAIQTQLNAKAASSHTHSYLPLAGGTLTGILTASKGISIPTVPSSWVSGMTATQCITFTGATTSSYSPMIKVVCASGNVGNLGVLGNQFGFYIYKNGRTANATDGHAYINTETGQFHSSSGFVGSLTGNASTATELVAAAAITNAEIDAMFA